jgi:hypothetical protein
MQFLMEMLLNNIIVLLFLTLITYIAIDQKNKYIVKNGLTKEEFNLSFRQKFNEVVGYLFKKLVNALAVSIVISLISFRELFIPDVFHTVFLTILLIPYSEKYILKLVK